MDPDKDKQPEGESLDAPNEEPIQDLQSAPADALSKTPEELAEERAASGQVDKTPEELAKEAEKQLPFIKRIFRKVNVYFLVFMLLVVVAAVITIVNFLNSQNEPEEPNIATQQLSEEDLKELANTDATVGDASQTLTIQGNAIISGQTLMRGNLNVAGNLQTGGSINGPSLTISGQSNLGETQINDLQVAQNTAIQGTTTLRDLNVTGTSSFNGAITAGQLTVTRLIMNGNAVLEVPNHVSFTGPTPSHNTNSSVVGNGGSVSMSGSDTAGTITINTGNNPTAGCWARVNFRANFTAQPRVVVSPVGSAASQTRYYVERSTSGFNICTSVPAPNNQTFYFDYFVAG